MWNLSLSLSLFFFAIEVGIHSLLQGIFLTQELYQVSCIAGGFFTIWATREALNSRYFEQNDQTPVQNEDLNFK